MSQLSDQNSLRGALSAVNFTSSDISADIGTNFNRWVARAAIVAPLWLGSFAWAAEPTTQQEPESLLESPLSHAILNEIVVLRPKKGHVFNLEAPNRCGSTNESAIESKEDELQCQMLHPGKRVLDLFICDEAKTFCRQEAFSLDVREPKSLQARIDYKLSKWFDVSDLFFSKSSVELKSKTARGFLRNDFKGALKLAKSEKKRVLAYVTQTFCEPCQLYKELVFASDEFLPALDTYVPVQIDIDSDLERPNFSTWNVLFTPTLIVFDQNGVELHRTGLFFDPKDLLAWLDQVGPSSINEVLIKEEAQLERADLQKKIEYQLILGRNRFELARSLATAERLAELDAGWRNVANYLSVMSVTDEAEFHSRALSIELKEGLKTAWERRLLAFIFYDLRSASDQVAVTAWTQELLSLNEAALKSDSASLALLIDHLSMLLNTPHPLRVSDREKHRNKIETAIALARAFQLPLGVSESAELEKDLKKLSKIAAELKIDPAKKSELVAIKDVAKGLELNFASLADEDLAAQVYDLAREKKHEEVLARLKILLPRLKALNYDKMMLIKVAAIKEVEGVDAALNLIESELQEIELPRAPGSTSKHSFVKKIRALESSYRVGS